MRIILGSQSPRRIEILNFFNLPFIQVSPTFEEKHEKICKDPISYANEIAINKALSIAPHYPNDLIITADTIVFCDGKLFTKPKDEEEAFKILKELSGNWHSVFTGVCVHKKGKTISQAEETKVLFHKLYEDQIKKYHNHFYFMDKAGGYAIQGGGSIIVKRVEGCYYNIMGMPINTTKDLLYQMGVDLWDYLEK